jgi:hypothetical protein
MARIFINHSSFGEFALASGLNPRARRRYTAGRTAGGKPLRSQALQTRTRARGASLACLLGLAFACPGFEASAAADVLERSYNRSRTGANTAETVLTPANVDSSANRFHRRFVMTVDGRIEGSPLYASGVVIAGGMHNVVYVATMHNTVYAFDADTGAELSARWLGAPVTGSDLQHLKPATIHAEWGVASTPFIDRHFQMQRAGLALVTKPGGAKAIVIAFGGAEGLGSSSGPSYTYPSPVDDRGASSDVLSNTPCVSPGLERRCVGNVAQTCQDVSGGKFFRSVQDCNATPAGGNFVQLCQKSTGKCCAPGAGNSCR